jgi:hypothetical protein
MKEFLSQLPEECQDIKIEPRHKVALHHRTVGNDIWVVLLTTMPGDNNKAWKLRKGEYWQLGPKHGTRDRWIRENLPPLVEGRKNPSKPKMLFLF